VSSLPIGHGKDTRSGTESDRACCVSCGTCTKGGFGKLQVQADESVVGERAFTERGGEEEWGPPGDSSLVSLLEA
jgi:hypothetical protein